MDDTVNQIVTDACANNGVLLRELLAWCGSAVGLVIGGSSLLANFRKRLPAGLLPIVETLALNFVKTEASQAAAHQQAKGGPTP